MLRLNQSDGHKIGTMTPASSWRLFIPHYVPVLDRFQPRCRNRSGVRREKRPSSVSLHGTSRLPPKTFSWNFEMGDFYGDKTAYLFCSEKWAKSTLYNYNVSPSEKRTKNTAVSEVGETVDDLSIARCNVPSETQKNCCPAEWAVCINVQLTETQFCSTTT